MDPLIAAARKARENACCAYSGFAVGAALEGDDGAIYTGCNIENVSYGLTICAERVALFKALSEGATQFLRIVVATEAERLTPPCGACRQILWEFCGDLPVTAVNRTGEDRTWRLSQLFPDPFDARNLE
jgi:cytidine deaminase